MIDKKYKTCATCEHDYYSSLIGAGRACAQCDINYIEWKLCSYKEALKRESCELCVHHINHGEFRTCNRTDCQFELDMNIVNELFPSLININAHTIKGILE